MRKFEVFLVLLMLSVVLFGMPKITQAENKERFYGIILKEDDSKIISQFKQKIQKENVKIRNEFKNKKFMTFKTKEGLEKVKNKFKKYGDVYELNQNTQVFSNIDWNFEETNGIEAIDSLNLTGRNVNIAVIDTGISDNTELNNKIIKRYDCFNSGTETPGCETVSDSEIIIEHGTNVSGLIASNNYGIAKNAKLYDFNIWDERYDLTAKPNTCESPGDNELDGIGQLNEEAKMDAYEEISNIIEFGRPEDKPHIINMSYGSNQYNLFEEAILKSLNDSGVLLVAATGNCSTVQEPKEVSYPAKYGFVVAVNLINENGDTEGSHIGSEVDVVAPGENVKSINKNNEEVLLSWGTSFAAPHISGILALYKEHYPSFTSNELKQLLFQSTKNLGEEGKDDKYGYGLPNAVPPKIYEINRKFELNGEYTIYHFPKDYANNKNELLNGEYKAIRGTGWNEKLKRFEYYRIHKINSDDSVGEEIGWIKADESMDGIEKERKIIDFKYDSLSLYSSPSTDDPYRTIQINRNRIRTHVTEDVKVVGDKEWFMINLPEYGITNKWIINKEIYQTGLMDNVAGRSTIEQNVYSGSNLFNNSFSGYAQFSPGGYIEYKFEKPVSVNHLYTNFDENYINDSLNLSIDFKDTSGKTYNFNVNKENANKYADIGFFENIISYKIQNNGSTNLNAREIEIYGNYKEIAESAKDLDLSFKFNSRNYTFYDNAITKENPITEDVYQMDAIVTKGFYWLEEKDGFRWYKVSVPEAGIKDKWVEVEDNDGRYIYNQGLMDKVASRSTIEEKVYSGYDLMDNSQSGYSQISPNGYIQYRFEQPVTVEQFYMKKLDKSFSPDVKLELELLNQTGENLTTIPINDDEYFKVINNIVLQDSIYGYRIKNTGSDTAKIRQFELFGDYSKISNPTISLNAEFKFNSREYTFYDDKTTLENPITKDVYQMNAKVSEGFFWEENKDGFRWYKVSVPEAGIVDKWVKVESNDGRYIYEQGLMDNVSGRSTIENDVYSGNDLTDNSQSGYTQLSPSGYIQYRFEQPVTVNNFFIKKLDKRLNPEAKLKIDFLDEQQNVKFSKTIDDNDYFNQIVNLEGLAELEKREGIYSYKITNIGSATEYLREFELFGSYGTTAFEPVIIKQTFNFNSRNYTFYDDYESKANAITKDVYQLSAVVSEAYFWEESKKGFRWYKVSIPEVGIENKWVQVNSNDGTNIYNKGLLDLVTSSLVSKDIVYSENDLFNNSFSGYTHLNSNGELEYKFDKPINVNLYYVEKLNKQFNPNSQIVLELLNQQGGQLKEIIIDDDEYFKMINSLVESITGVYGFRIKNTGSSVEYVRELELFGSLAE